ncbi:acyl-CoA thioesterase [Sphingomonas sp. STIS6.2]|uniref:acyl-CoA thioesterase n=1 Tax=Sphingomonas sp. STIS6.2 TaxID=1379700 RepID=UPI000D1431CF|nr:acyl-CoA thioesterase domain-containing protein [Sphingomonas sp. STIS6.2]
MTETLSTPDLAAELVALLDLESLDTDLFRGPQRPGATARVFGGQVVAQALMAAQLSVDAPAVAHSMHAYFLRAGTETQPIIFRVERDFDGKSFANRRVTASQNGATILTLAASFQRPEAGLEHATAMPDLPPPEELRSLDILAGDYAGTLIGPLASRWSANWACHCAPGSKPACLSLLELAQRARGFGPCDAPCLAGNRRRRDDKRQHAGTDEIVG